MKVHTPARLASQFEIYPPLGQEPPPFVWKDKVTVMLTMFVGELSQMQVATDLGNAIIEKL
jgi:hypothetical protein